MIEKINEQLKKIHFYFNIEDEQDIQISHLGIWYIVEEVIIIKRAIDGDIIQFRCRSLDEKVDGVFRFFASEKFTQQYSLMLHNFMISKGMPCTNQA